MVSKPHAVESLCPLFLQLASVGPQLWVECAAAMAEGDQSSSAQEVMELLPVHLRVVATHPHKLLLQQLHTQYVGGRWYEWALPGGWALAWWHEWVGVA